MDLGSVFETLTFISAVLTILLILLQQRGAILGSASSSELYTTRRGLEKSMFVATVFFSCVFVVSIIGILLIPS